MRELKELNSEIKKKIQQSTSIQVFDALNTLSEDEINYIKKDLDTSPFHKETFHKYLNFYQYVFFEYVLKNYEKKYGTAHGREVYSLFIPDKINKKSFKDKIFESIKSIIENNYHFSKEQEKNFTTLLKYSGLPEQYKNSVYEEIAKLISKNKKLRDPEYSEDINKNLIEKSFKHDPRKVLKAYLKYNGQQVVEDFFDSDYETFQKENNINEKDNDFYGGEVNYYFKENNFYFKIYNPSNLNFEIEKDNGEVESINQIDFEYRIKENDNIITFNSIKRSFFRMNRKEKKSSIEIGIFDKRDGKCILLKSLEDKEEHEEFNESKHFDENKVFNLEELKNSNYKVFLWGTNKLSDFIVGEYIQESDFKCVNEEIKVYDLNLTKDTKFFFNSPDNYSINIKCLKQKVNKVLLTEDSKYSLFLNDKKIFYNDLFFSLNSSENLEWDKLTATVNNVKAFKKESFFIMRENDIKVSAGISILDVVIYYNNKAIKRHSLVYGKNYSGESLIFNEDIKKDNLIINGGKVDEKKIVADHGSKIIEIFVEKGKILKKIEALNEMPIIKTSYDEDEPNFQSIENYQYDGNSVGYDIWTPDVGGFIVYNLKSNGDVDDKRPLEKEKEEHVSLLESGRLNFKDVVNIYFKYKDYAPILLYEKDNEIIFSNGAYQLKSIIGDVFYKLVEVYVIDKKIKIKTSSIFPNPNENYTIKEKFNHVNSPFYMSFLVVRNKIDFENKKYLINNINFPSFTNIINSRRFENYFYLLSQKNWIKSVKKETMKDLYFKACSRSDLVEELVKFHFNSEFDVLLSNDIKFIKSFKNINLLDNYKNNIGIEYLKVFSKNRVYYLQLENLKQFTDESSFSKEKKINNAYFNYLIKDNKSKENITSSHINQLELRYEYRHFFNVFGNIVHDDNIKILLKETFYIVDLLNRDKENFYKNYYKAMNLNTILCDYTSLFEYIYILGKLINKGAPYERPESI